MKRHFIKEDIQMANKHIERCSIKEMQIKEMQIKEMQMKAAMRFDYILIRIAKIKNSDNTKC